MRDPQQSYSTEVIKHACHFLHRWLNKIQGFLKAEFILDVTKWTEFQVYGMKMLGFFFPPCTFVFNGTINNKNSVYCRSSTYMWNDHLKCIYCNRGQYVWTYGGVCAVWTLTGEGCCYSCLWEYMVKEASKSVYTQVEDGTRIRQMYLPRFTQWEISLLRLEQSGRLPWNE